MEFPQDAVAQIKEEVGNRQTSSASVTKKHYMLLSFDLVNSTAFKTARPKDWPAVTKKFYEFVEDQLIKRFDGFRVWKYVGDEVLLYKRVYSKHQITGAVPRVYEALQRTISRLHSTYPDTKEFLSVKGTMWFAEVHDVPPGDLEKLDFKYRNLVVANPTSETGLADFLGPDIDIGFRIARFSSARRLVLSADLAYLLWKDRTAAPDVEEKVKITSFEQLKGVWANRHYPIVWYEEDWRGIEGTFAYDERYHNPVIQKVIAGETRDLRYIHKVTVDRQDDVRLEALWATLDVPSTEADNDVVPGVMVPTVEVHCAAVCFDDAGRILLGKRRADKKRLPGAWEFGCGQVGYSESFKETLSRSYREDFGAELEFGEELIPIRAYEISDPRRTIPGLLFVARVRNPGDVTNHKHEAIHWLDPARVNDILHEPTVPDFALTVAKAVDAWRSEHKDTREGAA
jgi:hypothetical protein